MLHSYRRRLLGTSLLVSAPLTAAPLYAQNASAPQATAPQPTADDTTASEGETIVVTGSLITNPNLQQSAPVNVTNSEELQLRQTNVAEEVLRTIPGVVPSIGSAVNNGATGAAFVDLRGLGNNRNVVLLDGNRITPTGSVGRTDLNNIPVALVERVDVLTGGASTTYGADAVTGVVNFITKKDFSGAEISLSDQITEKGDGNFFRADVTLGANFDDGRGNAVLSIGYQSSDAVYQGDRAFSTTNISSFTGAPGGSGTTVPARFTGTRGIDPVTGQPSINPADTNGPTRQINPATGTAGGTFALFNFNPYNIFQTPFKRYNMYGAAHYEISDGIEIYTRGLFSKNEVISIIAPSGSFGQTVAINLNNPYLPATLRNQLCAFDIDPRAAVYTPRFTPTECANAAVATGPSDPNYRVFGTGVAAPVNYDANGNGTIDASDTNNPNPAIGLGRRLVEGPPRVTDFVSNIFDYRAGIRGNITDTIRFDVSGSYGETELRTTVKGFTRQSRIRQALLADNTTSCQNPTGGCVPLNVFGAAGTITPAMYNFLYADSTSLARSSLAQGRAIVSGDFGATLPWATDPINFAIGGEYRNYTSSLEADTLAQTSGELGGAGAPAVPFVGKYDVYEAIGELNLPIVADKPFFDSLNLEAGVRYSHYTIDAAGSPKFNTTTYKFGGNWAPVKDVKFRGSYAHAVRAPNINELFAPVATGLTSLAADPCSGTKPFGAANTNLRNICLAQGAPPGTIGSIANPTAQQANATAGGGLYLKPEISDSYTFGVVLQPSFVPGLSLTVDYYNIKIKKAITAPTAADAITQCFGNITAASATSVPCTIIRRNPLTGGLDGDQSINPGLYLPLSNQGRLFTDGIDVSLNYRRDLGFAKFSLAASGNYTFHSKFQAISVTSANTPMLSLYRECVGYYSTSCGGAGGVNAGSLQPKFTWNVRTTFSVDDVDLSLLWRHIDKMQQEPASKTDPFGNGPACGPGNMKGCAPEEGYPDNFQKIKAFDYFDLTGRFGISSNLDLTISVQNLLDKKPPIVGTGIGTTSFNSGNTYPSTYDTLGRRYAVGAKLKF